MSKIETQGQPNTTDMSAIRPRESTLRLVTECPRLAEDNFVNALVTYGAYMREDCRMNCGEVNNLVDKHIGNYLAGGRQSRARLLDTVEALIPIRDGKKDLTPEAMMRVAELHEGYPQFSMQELSQGVPINVGSGTH